MVLVLCGLIPWRKWSVGKVIIAGLIIAAVLTVVIIGMVSGVITSEDPTLQYMCLACAILTGVIGLASGVYAIYNLATRPTTDTLNVPDLNPLYEQKHQRLSQRQQAANSSPKSLNDEQLKLRAEMTRYSDEQRLIHGEPPRQRQQAANNSPKPLNDTTEASSRNDKIT